MFLITGLRPNTEWLSNESATKHRMNSHIPAFFVSFIVGIHHPSCLFCCIFHLCRSFFLRFFHWILDSVFHLFFLFFFSILHFFPSFWSSFFIPRFFLSKCSSFFIPFFLVVTFPSHALFSSVLYIFIPWFLLKNMMLWFFDVEFQFLHPSDFFTLIFATWRHSQATPDHKAGKGQILDAYPDTSRP